MKEEKKLTLEEIQEQAKNQTPQPIKKREIVIETDGNQAKIIKAEVAGAFELTAILQGLLDGLKKT